MKLNKTGMITSFFAALSLYIVLLLFTGCAPTPAGPSSGGSTSPLSIVKEREMAEKQLAIRNFPAALKHLQKVLEANPSDPQVHYDLSIVYRAKGMNDKALRHLKEAIRLKPHYPEAFNALGSLYLDMKQYDKAIKWLEKAATDIYYKTPHYAYFNLGRTYEALKKYDLAKENYMRAVEIAPKFSRAYFRLGAIAEMEGNLKQARLYYEKALLYNSQNPEYYYNLGRVYFAMKEYKKAAESFQRVRILAPATELCDKAEGYLRWLRRYKKIENL